MITKSVRSNLGRLGLATAGLAFAALNLAAESRVTTHIPFEFAAAGKTMPAGDYSLQPLGPGVVLLAAAETSDRALLLINTSSKDASPPGLKFDSSGAIPQLSGVQSSSGTWQFLVPAGAKSGTTAVALRSKK